MSDHKTNSNRKRPSRGASLVEMVLSMTAGAVLFGLAICTVEQAMKLNNSGKAQANHQRTVARLGQQFRVDAHAAQSFALGKDGESARLTLQFFEAPSVTYTVMNHQVVRTARNEDGHTVREDYRLAEKRQARFEVTKPNRAVLSIVRSTPEGEFLESRIAAGAYRFSALQSLKQGQ